MDYFPTFIKVKDKTVLVVGGGEDALHKLRLLRKSSAHIVIFGVVDDPVVAEWIADGIITHHARMPVAADLDDAAFAYIGTPDAIWRDAAIALFSSYALPYSVIDDKARSSFITPAMVDRDPVVVAIGTEGTGPIIARDIKQRIEAELNPLTGIIAKTAGLFRPRVDHLPHGGPRRKFWQRYLDEVVPAVVMAGPEHPETHLKAGLEHLLAEHDICASSGPHTISGDLNKSHQPASRSINVVITAGGHADNLTRQALRWLHDADIVLYHRQTPHDMLELTRREASKIEWANNRNLDAATCRKVLAAARSGQSVVVMMPDDHLPITLAEMTAAGLTIDYAAYAAPHHFARLNERPQRPDPTHNQAIGPTLGPTLG